MSAYSSRLHHYLHRLLETRAARFWQALPPTTSKGLLEALVAVILDEQASGEGQVPLAPTRYTLTLPLQQAEALRQNSPLLDELAIAIHQAGHDAGRRFPVLPRIQLEVAPTPPPQGFDLQAEIWEPEHLKRVPLDPKINIVPPSAYLIINGTQVFSLEQPIIHIGRRPDNDLVLDDPRVSRLHAQLRANRGRFMLFDLHSTGGTFVNQQRITATMLYPGDVILLAGMTLVYGQRATRPLQDNAYENPEIVSDLHTTTRLKWPPQNE
ncbi:MAG: FHA domain-containing protein [Chloroflexi bacterium]|nr:FHA domain-containing protein [Chloroflexota bacterium]